jgi:hypothetical protein
MMNRVSKSTNDSPQPNDRLALHRSLHRFNWPQSSSFARSCSFCLFLCVLLIGRASNWAITLCATLTFASLAGAGHAGANATTLAPLALTCGESFARFGDRTLALKKTKHARRTIRTHFFDSLIPGRFGRLEALPDWICDLRTLVPYPGAGALDQIVDLAFAN